MKVLAIYVDEFGYNPSQKNLEGADDAGKGGVFRDAVLALIQVEEGDEENDVASRGKKLVNHLKWVSRKNNCSQVILHSFAHLGESKASPEFSKLVFDDAERRLLNTGFLVAQTPFGYFFDLDIKAPGYSLARIWATL